MDSGAPGQRGRDAASHAAPEVAAATGTVTTLRRTLVAQRAPGTRLNRKRALLAQIVLRRVSVLAYLFVNSIYVVCLQQMFCGKSNVNVTMQNFFQ